MVNIKSEKTKRIVFFVLICAIAAYFLYIMVNFYSSDKSGTVQLSFKTSDTNAVTKAQAIYKLQPNGGRLVMTQKEEIQTVMENALGTPITLETVNGSIKNISLTFTYDDKMLTIPEKDIVIASYNAKTRKITQIKSKTNMTKNTIHATVSENSTLFLADKQKLLVFSQS